LQKSDEIDINNVVFSDLGLSPQALKRLEKVGYVAPSPIQAAFIPLAIKGGDCTGQARTGTGKTASFVLPVLERIDQKAKETQVLVLVPTRELGEQVADEARKLAPKKGLEVAVLVGGKPIGKQIRALEQGAQIVVGTPGRVIDLLKRGKLILETVKILVLDEADRMLDIGFRPEIEKILKYCPKERQTLLLSATMPPPVERLAKKYMQNPERVDLSDDSIAVDTIEQFYATVDHDRKLRLLVNVLRQEKPSQALVFTRTKKGAEKLHKQFSKRLSQTAVLHGDLPQHKRDRAMKAFRNGKLRMLIATDVVGRGIDVSGISHIINYDIPEFCDDYVHRVGRTGRLSSDEKGRAITFVTKEQGDQLTSIEKRINKMLDEYDLHKFEAYRPRPPRAKVEDDVQSEEEFEDFCIA